MKLPSKKYSIIYADPPWSFRVWSDKGKGRSAEKHYKTMTKKDIQDLPVKDICDKNCVLFLWVTFPCLEEGIELIRAWGFQYKTCAFTWAKKNKFCNGFFVGMGYYTRSNSEICLLATRGKPLKRISKSVRQLVVEKVRDHSRKPDSVRTRIVELFGDIPRIELFAREKIDGWDAWGDEV
jgi:N6-adenosine-specific RNA methylase IME4